MEDIAMAEVITNPTEFENRLEYSLKGKEAGSEKSIVTDVEYPNDFEKKKTASGANSDNTEDGADIENVAETDTEKKSWWSYFWPFGKKSDAEESLADSDTKKADTNKKAETASSDEKEDVKENELAKNTQKSNVPTSEADSEGTSEAEAIKEELADNKNEADSESATAEKEAAGEGDDETKVAENQSDTEKAEANKVEDKAIAENRAKTDKEDKTESSASKKSAAEKPSTARRTAPKEDKTIAANTPKKKSSPKTSPRSTRPSTYEAPDQKRIASKKAPAATQKASGCVVVVGAFKQAEGATLLEKQLKEAKYQTTTGFTNQLKYVGIPVDCNDETRIAKIRAEVDAKFNIQSWVLWKW